jgi:8-oxo-dGTP diphosphatase
MSITLGVISIAEIRASFPVVVHMLLLRSGVSLTSQQTDQKTAKQGVELLLLRRANTGFMDGYFSLPGGHVEQNELPLAGVIRELQEEVGIAVSAAKPLAVLPYRSGRHLGYNFVFTATQWLGRAQIAEPQSADLLCWVPLTALPNPHAPWLAQVVELHAEQNGPWYSELSY